VQNEVSIAHPLKPSVRRHTQPVSPSLRCQCDTRYAVTTRTAATVWPTNIVYCGTPSTCMHGGDHLRVFILLSIPATLGFSHSMTAEVSRGPDINDSRSPLDPKLYRQIILPNGIRCVLIQDTLAMNQVDRFDCLGINEELSDDESEEEEKKSGDVTEGLSPKNEALRHVPDDSDDSDNESDDNEEGGKQEAHSTRDAAIAILVGAGSMHDPKECQGLAHFLEHLLFMGSEKYPVENGYDAFVSKHGGSDNAYTEWEHTVYSLEIPQEYIWPALDRLAQFFVAPLLLESAVDRELNAIESEFQLHANSDSCRMEQLLCAAASSDHPIASFSWGNLKSLRELPEQLGIDPLEKLRSFFNQHYYGANMRLVLSAAYTLDEMEKHVTQIFQPVPSMPREHGPFSSKVKENEITSWEAHYKTGFETKGSPWSSDRLGRIYRVVPVKERHSICLTWPLPPNSNPWQGKPGDFVAHLLGHEASGSLFAALRKKSWALSCLSDGEENYSSHSVFTLSFVLSEEGFRNWRAVVEMCFQYIGIMKRIGSCGWPDWIFDELKTTSELSYKYASEESPDETVDTIVLDMLPFLKLPPDRLLDGTSLLFEFDDDGVASILEQHLRPSNCRIDLSSSTFGRASDFDVDVESQLTIKTTVDLDDIPVDEVSFDPVSCPPPFTEPWFGTRFWCHSFPPEWIKILDELFTANDATEELRLPPLNPFIPKNLDLKSLPANDSRHPLLDMPIKVCEQVGKEKHWFGGLIVQYNSESNMVRISFDGDRDEWFGLDNDIDFFTPQKLANRSFQASMNGDKVKLRRSYESQMTEESLRFPIIPPPSPPNRVPQEVCSSQSLRLWWLQDRTFHRPIADVRLSIVCKEANKTPFHKACAELAVALCVDEMIETSYLAEVCDLHVSISSTDDGFVLRVHGFNDNLKSLLELSLSKLFRVQLSTGQDGAFISENRFRFCLAAVRRKYRNCNMKAATLSSSLRVEAMRTNLWSASSKLHALEDVDLASFLATAKEILCTVSFECLLHGNVDKDDAKHVMKSLLDNLKVYAKASMPRKQYPKHSVLRAPHANDLPVILVPSKDAKDPNTSVEVYFQISKDNTRDRVIIDLLVDMMEEPFYDQIRTKDQFGYDVSCDVRWSWGIMGFLFSIVSNNKSAKEATERIDDFLRSFHEQLQRMGANEFIEAKIAVAKEKLEMFNSLNEETDSYWEEIRDGRFEWQVWREEAILLSELTQAEVVLAFKNWLLPNQRRRGFVVQVVGNGDNGSKTDRPEVAMETFDDFVAERVNNFRSLCKNQVWGKVNSKLF